MKKEPARLVLADSQTLSRQGLKCLLSQNGEFTVVGEASTGPDALDTIEKEQPDIAILDLFLPTLSCFKLIETCQTVAPKTQLVILADRAPDMLVGAAVKAGARGYFLRSEGVDVLIPGLRKVRSGMTAFAHCLSDRITDICQHWMRDKARLSPREIEVIMLLCEGYSSVEIGERLSLSSKTVDSYREHIRKKLRMKDFHEIRRFAAESGLIIATQQRVA
jgi:DNA-binding NarL/FixJ family response regulator